MKDGRNDVVGAKDFWRGQGAVPLLDWDDAFYGFKQDEQGISFTLASCIPGGPENSRQLRTKDYPEAHGDEPGSFRERPLERRD